ncbi:MAG TPA: FtsX-like permease family protein [Thermodesulfovibrionales bacterium]|nr:FtsX-like permease family protein [Thermodesulfovibrionales bacterium]
MSTINIPGLAQRNLKRKIIRTLILLLLVAVVTGTLLGATVFITGMKNALRIGTYRLGADVLVVPAKNETQAKAALLSGEPTSFYMSRSVYDSVKGLEGVKRASVQLFIKPTSFTCCYNVETFLVAFDPESDFTVTPWLQKKLTAPLSDEEVIVGSTLPVITGDILPFFGTPFTVAGTMEPTGMKFFDQSVFMTLRAAYAMAEHSKTKSIQPLEVEKDQVSAVLVQVQDGFTPERVAIRIEHAIDGVKAIASDEVTSTVRRQLGGLLKGILIISAVLWVLALLMTGFAFYMIVNERQRELGLLRAMGATKGQVFRLIITEAVILSIAGGLTGIAAGGGILFALKGVIVQSLRLPYLLPSVPVLAELIAGALIFSVITGLLASMLPAYLASGMEPYDAIRKGE